MPTEKGIPKPPENVYMVDDKGKPTLSYWKWFARIFDNFPKVQTFDAVVTATNTLAAQSTSEENFAIGTVCNSSTNDRVIVCKPTLTTNVAIGNARIPAAGTVALTFVNTGTSAILPPSETYQFTLIRK